MRVWLGGPRILGIRTGISLGREDLGWLSGNRQGQQASSIEGSFVYIIRGDHNLIKIGVSTNPNARIAQLRTASPFPIEFSYIAVTPGDGLDIEAAAHAALSRHRCNGEWFDVPVEMAVAAISGAAFSLNQPLQPVTQEMVGQIMQIAAAGGGNAQPQPSNFMRYLGYAMLVVVFLVAMLLTTIITQAAKAEPLGMEEKVYVATTVASLLVLNNCKEYEVIENSFQKYADQLGVDPDVAGPAIMEAMRLGAGLDYDRTKLVPGITRMLGEVFTEFDADRHRDNVKFCRKTGGLLVDRGLIRKK